MKKIFLVVGLIFFVGCVSKTEINKNNYQISYKKMKQNAKMEWQELNNQK